MVCVCVSGCVLNVSMYESVYCAEGLYFSAFHLHRITSHLSMESNELGEEGKK